MSARMSNRASLASAALSLGLMAVFAGTPSFAKEAAPDPASTAAPDSAPAPVSLVPSTPEIYSPPAPARAPAPTYSLSGTPARMSPPAPSSASGSGSASAPRSPAPDEDIRDIRGPKSIFPLWLVAAWLAAGLLLAAGAYAWWRWTHRPHPPRPLELFEIALQRIEEARPLMQPSTVREFSIAISDIVRQYIEGAMQVTATHRTTEEFLRDLLGSSNSALAAHRNLLAEFLKQCDLAKFAGMGLSLPIMESLYESARVFVIETSKPEPAPTVTAGAAAAAAA